MIVAFSLLFLLLQLDNLLQHIVFFLLGMRQFLSKLLNQVIVDLKFLVVFAVCDLCLCLLLLLQRKVGLNLLL